MITSIANSLITINRPNRQAPELWKLFQDFCLHLSSKKIYPHTFQPNITYIFRYLKEKTRKVIHANIPGKYSQFHALVWTKEKRGTQRLIATLNRQDVIKGAKHQLNEVEHSKNSFVKDDKLPHKIARGGTTGLCTRFVLDDVSSEGTLVANMNLNESQSLICCFLISLSGSASASYWQIQLLKLPIYF